MINALLCIIFFLFSSSVSALGSGEVLMSKTNKILLCYEGTSASSTSCMMNLEATKKIEYNKTYNNFIKKIRKMKSDLDYPDDFISNVIKTKKNFDDYMKHECRAYSLISSEKDSYAYHTIYSRCMVTLYDQRIRFYQDYDFS